jgi:hypothetical protein
MICFSAVIAVARKSQPWRQEQRITRRRASLRRFHDGGRDFHWEFLDALASETIGYARFHFSYVSTLPDSAGRSVYFEGMSQFRFSYGLIAEYREAWDRGVALVQLGFPAERIRRIVEKTRQCAEHDRRGSS